MVILASEIMHPIRYENIMSMNDFSAGTMQKKINELYSTLFLISYPKHNFIDHTDKNAETAIAAATVNTLKTNAPTFSLKT
ncbi:hypothetical protein A7S32_15700 [Salmonella enterica subsp. diarizonae serovar 59:[k]:z35]|nr:hypothetical protein A7S32_15700 [Salmonella enterica subsp. diarizonae serovar 59:[k]:z35]